jgi:DNA (cytosine-5)-methyltransferase 1
MGFSDEDFFKAKNAGISNTQLYKMVGNSIVVDVLYHLFRKMFVEKESESNQLTLF